MIEQQQQQSTGTHAPQTGTIYLNELPEGAQIVAFGHRSGAETHQACPRCYFLANLYLGQGITPAPGPLYFAVGTAVHHGLANMLLGYDFDTCVTAALNSLTESAAFQALSLNQVYSMNTTVDTQTEQLVLVEGLLYAFWVYALPGLMKDFEVLCVETGAVEYVPIPIPIIERCDTPVACNGYGYTCQLPIGHMGDCDWHTQESLGPLQYVAIQSRPDAILRNRKTHEVCGISWKTIDDPSDLRRSQLVNDLQGFMEMYYGERILEKLASQAPSDEEFKRALSNLLFGLEQMTDLNLVATRLEEIADQARELAKSTRNIPTTIDYIQTIFLVKGPRRQIADDTPPEVSNYTGESLDEYGGYQPGKQYRQMSHLCYRYRNANVETVTQELYKSGPNKGKPKPVNVSDPNYFEESWAYRFHKPGNESFSSLSNKWLTSPIQPEQIRDWVDRLHAGSVYPSCLSDERNPSPLAKLIRFEEPLYKDNMRAASHVKQQHNRFVAIARARQLFDDLLSGGNQGVTLAPTIEEVMVNLDELFPQQLISCRTPYKCAYHGFCHGTELIQIDFNTIPEGFELRVPHHAAEREFFEREEE